MEALRRANDGHCVGYGDDPHTEAAVGKFREEFGPMWRCSLFSRDGGECTEFAGADASVSRCAVPGVFAYLR